MTDVWVATVEPYHDNSTVLGVAADADGAQRYCSGDVGVGAGIDWETSEDGEEFHGTVTRSPYGAWVGNDADYLVQRFTLGAGSR